MSEETPPQSIDILLVEYDPAEAKRIESLVNKNSDQIRIKWVKTLKETIDIIHKNKFIAILLSLDFPDIKGEKALKEVRELKPDLPIVVITDSENEDELELLDKGADDLLCRKFLYSSLLLKTIYSNINKKKIENELKTLRRELENHNIDRGKDIAKEKDSIGNGEIKADAEEDAARERVYLEELKIREDILNTIAQSAADILKSEEWEEAVNDIIKKIGVITKVSRVYLFENHKDSSGVIYSSQKFEWVAENIASQIDNSELQNMPLEKAGYRRWIKLLSRGEIIKGEVNDFPESERELLKSQEILSIIVLPVFVNKKWWGFIGFDSCDKTRKWSKTEESALKTTANLIGSAIQHSLLEKELRLREARLRETSFLAGIGHFEFDIVLNRIYLSEGIYNIVNVKPETLHISFEDSIKYIHPEERKEVLDTYQHILSTGKSDNIIFRILLNDNYVKKIWVKWETVRDTKGDVRFIRGVVQDITERMEAEERILKLSHAVEHSPAIVYITDNEERIEYVNKKFTEVTGYEFEEVEGKRPSMWGSGYHGNDFYEEMLDTIYSGKEWTGEIKNRKKNGELFWQWTSISPLINADGDITHYVAVSLDITEKKEMTEDLIAAKKKAEESDKIKSEFLALISHEIRTPINVIKSYTDFIKEEADKELKEKMQFAFEGIEETTNRIIRSIELILNAAEIISGSYEAQKTLFNLESIIEEKYWEFKSKAENKGLKFNFASNTNETTIKADKYSITQMLIYLLENAVKFTNEGEVEIILYRDDKKRLVLKIVDTGIGMHDSFLDRIFIPFSQEDTGLSRTFEGMGLGSTLIKHYAELNNAEIKIESVKDAGTTFEIIFN